MTGSKYYRCMGDVVAVALSDAEVKPIAMWINSVRQRSQQSHVACVQINTERLLGIGVYGCHTKLQREILERLCFKM